MHISLFFNNFVDYFINILVMKKTDIEKENERLKKALEQKKNEIKKLKQQNKYAKDTKKSLKEENKRLKAECDQVLKKTPVLRKSLSEQKAQRWQNLEQKIRDRFPADTARSVLSELAPNFMPGQDAGSEE